MNHFKKVLTFFTSLTIVALFAILSTSLTPTALADKGQESSTQSPAGAACPNPILTFRSPLHTDHPNKVDFHFKLKNCATTTPARNYKLITDLPGGANAGWKIDYSSNVNAQNIIKVTKGDIINFDATISAPDNAKVAEQAVSLTAKWTDGNGKDTLGFRYIVENECVKKDPVLSAVPDTKTGKPGNKVPFLVTLDNKNVGCSAPYPDYKFSVVGGMPSGWKVDFTKADDSNLTDDTMQNLIDKRDFKVKITSPKGAQDKTFTIKATNTNNSNFSHTLNLTYNVEVDPNPCTGTDKNPHFTCQSNACVSVNACGQNTDGCTTAGGSCGETPTCTPRPACLDANPPCKMPITVDMCQPTPTPTFTPTPTPKVYCLNAEKNPHLECQNNACVSVKSCGKNATGCTTEGDSCGNNTFTPVLSVTGYGGRTCVDNSIVQLMKIGWTHPASAATFSVKNSSTRGGPYTNVTTTSNFEYTVPAAVEGYYYVVSANGGPNSNEIFAMIPDVTMCPTITITPTVNPTCTPRPACLDANPPCKMPITKDMCQPTPTPTPGSCDNGGNNPYYVCQNNACVAVTDACGVNDEDCSSAGGSCGVNPGTTSLSFVIGLDSIGTTGTSRVSLFSESNKDPKRPQRDLRVEILNQNNDLVYKFSTEINYNSTENTANYGKFTGAVGIENDFPTGFYIMKVSVDGYLTKQLAGTLNIIKGQNNNIPAVNLITGDIDTDNTLGILDYNLLISCSIFAKTDEQKATCDSDSNFKVFADINDDGVIDQVDYSYFLQDYSIQNGD